MKKLSLALVFLLSASVHSARAEDGFTDREFTCSVFVRDRNAPPTNSGITTTFGTPVKVKVLAKDEWKIVTLGDYKGVKVRLALSKGRIHTMAISNGSDDIIGEDSSVRARRQDFWIPMNNQDLELAVNGVVYYVGCSDY